MSSKHFVNDPTHLVNSALESLTLVNPTLVLDRTNKIVYLRPDLPSSPFNRASSDSTQNTQRVALVSGGGAGHEPSFVGFVGPGLLSAAVSGTIFASPSSAQIDAAISSRLPLTSAASNGGGALVIVMNYTGDVLNFGVAVEKARARVGSKTNDGSAQHRPSDVDMVVVGDDVGVGRARGGKVGRRGIAGTVLVVKIAGALAALGHSLADVSKVARLVADNLVSVGASLEHVHVPGRKTTEDAQDDEDSIGPNDVELGMGIHNEPGCGRRSAADLSELVRQMLAQLLDRNDEDRAFVNVNSNEVVLLINNLGGVSPLEIGAITTEVTSQLRAEHNIRPARILAGTYMTSLNGLGFSITLLNVVNTDIGGPGMIELLDQPCEATGWTAPISKRSWEGTRGCGEFTEQRGGDDEQDTKSKAAQSGLSVDAKLFDTMLRGGLDAVIRAEPDVTKYDTIVGDGDCGIGMKRGAEALLDHISKEPLTGDVVADMAALTNIIENTMDGTSGALYSIFLNTITSALADQATASSSGSTATQKTWAEALRRGAEALSRYTPARPGDRTLIDALQPFVDTLARTGDASEAATAAQQGAEGTKGMKPGLGRAVYVGGAGWERVPDPGAWGLACFFAGLVGKDDIKC